MTEMFEDFLRRSGEPFTIVQQWGAIVRALVAADRTLFLVAVDSTMKPTGFVLAQTGYDHWGLKSVAVHQFYTGKHANGLLREFDDAICQWAKDEDADYIYGMSRRNVRAFARRLRLTPSAMMFVREVKHGQGDAAAGPAADRH